MSRPDGRHDLVIRGQRVVLPDGIGGHSIAIRDGRISLIAPVDTPISADQVIDLADDEVLLPGLVDTHVHVNEPGRTEWEGFATATRAAMAGGITTIIDMPLNSVPPTIDVAALAVKRAAARGQCHVDVGFWGGAVPGNLGDLAALYDAGVFGFKCFLLPSGVDEFPPLDADQFGDHLQVVADLGALMIVHAEDAATIAAATEPRGRRYADFLASRPDAAEQAAIVRVLARARATGARVHILHLSSGHALPVLHQARLEGTSITVETCPHYLTLTAEEVPDGATPFKCCPPIRGATNSEALWQGLADGVISLIVTDHSPSTPDLKQLDSGDFGQAWGGIASLQLSLPIVWTGARTRGFDLTHVARWMAEGPADLVGLTDKGRIRVGAAADLCVFAPDETFVVDPAALHHRHPITPYAGRTLTGVVRSTWLRGQRLTADAAMGHLLRRPQGMIDAHG